MVVKRRKIIMSNNNPYENQNYNNVYGNYDDFKDYDEPYVDSGANVIDLNSILVKSFIFMFIALIVTAGVAMYVASDLELVLRYCTPPNLYIIIALELGSVFLTNFAVKKEILPLAIVGFFAYSVFTGITFSVILVGYGIGSVGNAFVITATVFLLMSIYGIITKRDMDSVADYAFMALIGVIVTSLLNIFIFRSSGMDWIISAVSVVVFTVLTAYDVQKLKKMQALKGASENTKMVIALYGAMQLYLDFVNLFLDLVKILGRRD